MRPKILPKLLSFYRQFSIFIYLQNTLHGFILLGDLTEFSDSSAATAACRFCTIKSYVDNPLRTEREKTIY